MPINSRSEGIHDQRAITLFGFGNVCSNFDEDLLLQKEEKLKIRGGKELTSQLLKGFADPETSPADYAKLWENYLTLLSRPDHGLYYQSLFNKIMLYGK